MSVLRKHAALGVVPPGLLWWWMHWIRAGSSGTIAHHRILLPANQRFSTLARPATASS